MDPIEMHRERLGQQRLAVLALFCMLVAFIALGAALARADAPPPTFDVAAPMFLDVERPVLRAPSADIAVGPVSLPAERSGDTLIAIALVVAAVLRGTTALLGSTAMKDMWGRAPAVVQWGALALLTGGLAFADTIATGAPWKTALATALTGLFASWASQKVQKTEAAVKGGAA